MTNYSLPHYVVPPLDHDEMMRYRYHQHIDPRMRLERRVVAALIAFLHEQGYVAESVYIGEDEPIVVQPEGDTVASRTKAIMEEVFSVDDSWIYFRKGTDGVRWVRLVLGNSGDDVINDYGYSTSDDAWNNAMDWFTVTGIEQIVANL